MGGQLLTPVWILLNNNYNNAKQTNNESTTVSTTPIEKNFVYEQLQMTDPLITINTPKKVEAVKWDPLQRTQIVCCFSSSREIHMYLSVIRFVYLI